MGIYKEAKQVIQDLVAPEIRELKSEIKRLDEKIESVKKEFSSEMKRIEDMVETRQEMGQRLTKLETMQAYSLMVAGKEQKLIEIKERISKDSLYEWLNKHPECKPKKVERSIGVLSDKLPDIADVPAWVKEKIDEGVTFERNNTFLRMAGSLAKRGFTVEEVKSMLMRAIVDDFKESELDTTINSAFKNLGE